MAKSALECSKMSMLLQETLHMHDNMDKNKLDPRDVEVSSGLSDGIRDNAEVEERSSSSKASLLKNWPLMSTILVYCVFSLQEIAYSEVYFVCFMASSITFSILPPLNFKIISSVYLLDLVKW